jgi:flagellar basal body L-ring protein FlgH
MPLAAQQGRSTQDQPQGTQSNAPQLTLTAKQIRLNENNNASVDNNSGSTSTGKQKVSVILSCSEHHGQVGRRLKANFGVQLYNATKTFADALAEAVERLKLFFSV